MDENKHPLKDIEIARLRRENDELKRDNRKLGEMAYLLQMLNVNRNGIALILTALANGSSVARIYQIARQTQKKDKSIEADWMKAFPITTQKFDVDTY